MEMLLTVEQAADRLQLSPLTVRRQLARGALRGIKRGRVWRVPETALLETSPEVKKPVQERTVANALAALSQAQDTLRAATTGPLDAASDLAEVREGAPRDR